MLAFEDDLDAPIQRAAPPAPEGAVPRLLISDEGRIVHVAPAFDQLIRGSSAALSGTKLQDLITFCAPDVALRDQPLHLFTDEGGAWVQLVREGVHQVQLRDCGAMVFHFRFDWVAVGTGRRYLLMSLGEESDLSAVEAVSLLPAVAAAATSDRVAPAVPDYAPVKLRDLIRPVFAAANQSVRLVPPPVSWVDLPDVMIRADMNGKIIEMNRAGLACLGASMIGKNVGDVMDEAVRADLHRHQQRLSEAEAIAHMGYWRWIVGEETVTWSDEIYRIFGVSQDEFTPTMDHINARIARRDLARVSQTFQRALIEQNSYTMDFCIKRPDGELRYINCIGRCEKDDTGDVVALFGIMQDVTEQNAHARELREAKEAAERAYAAKSQFLANMSHELRTPLNAIIGFSEMMQRQLLGPIGTPRYLEYIDGIRQSGEHLLDLISDILDMSKIEAGKYNLDIEQFNFAKVMNLAAHMVESRARDAQVTLTTEITGDDTVIQADRRAVLQMALNLLSNAIKFTPAGGSVRLMASPDGEMMTLKVVDTGIGIPAHMIKNVARPFEQVANHYTRAHEGTGLGLAITKELVLMHGGRLEIESEVGKGTEVTITLPRLAARAASIVAQ